MSGSRSPEIPRDLLERVRGGDSAAFRDLVRRTHPLVYRWAVVRTADPDLADDVAQEAMLRMHRSIAEFRGEARFTTWLYRLTAHVATDMLRASARRARLGQRLMSTHLARTTSPSKGPASALDRSAILGVVGRFAEELPARQREVFHLVDVQGFEPTEAAAMLELSPSTARVHLHRARRALRSLLVERAPEIAEEYGGAE